VDAARLRVDEEHAVRVERDRVLEELATRGRRLDARGERAGLHLGDHDRASAPHDVVRADGDGDGPVIDLERVLCRDLGAFDLEAELLELRTRAPLPFPRPRETRLAPPSPRALLPREVRDERGDREDERGPAGAAR
jgi:hypothetical protein